MKRVTLALVFCFSFGCVNVVYADVWGRIAHTVGKAWEDTKRETTNVAHNTEKAVGKAWEDTKSESTRFAKNVENLCKGEEESKNCAGVAAGVLTAGAFALGDVGNAVEGLKLIANIL
jgi:hypothetical protein